MIVMKLKTSTSIALKFSAYVMLLLILFWIGINIWSITQRYRVEINRIELGTKDPRQGKRFYQNRSELIVVPYTKAIEKELKDHEVRKSIGKFDDEFILYKVQGNQIKISNISHLIRMQQELFMTTLLIICCGWILTFIISRIFISSSFKKINELVEFVKHIDIHNLHKPVPLSWPEDDEIRIIAQSIKTSLNIIKTQTDSLKDFVSYASHELKTPLATVHGLVDLGLKKNDITTIGPKIKKTLTGMNELLDSLVQITRREFTTIHNEETDIIPLIHDIYQNISHQFIDKHITTTLLLPNEYITSGKSDIITIIISNLLHNAYKFTAQQGEITISLEKNTLTVSDNGSWISQENLSKIRTRFRKKTENTNEWYGLWLYMVKLLVEKLWRTIQASSKKDKWTTMTISIKHNTSTI